MSAIQCAVAAFLGMNMAGCGSNVVFGPPQVVTVQGEPITLTVPAPPVPGPAPAGPENPAANCPPQTSTVNFGVFVDSNGNMEPLGPMPGPFPTQASGQKMVQLGQGVVGVPNIVTLTVPVAPVVVTAAPNGPLGGGVFGCLPAQTKTLYFGVSVDGQGSIIPLGPVQPPGQPVAASGQGQPPEGGPLGNLPTCGPGQGQPPQPGPEGNGP